MLYLLEKKHLDESNYRCILTAAHCLVNRWPSMIRIVIGEHNWNENYETNNTDVFDVASIKIHPFYDRYTGKFRFK